MKVVSTTLHREGLFMPMVGLVLRSHPPDCTIRVLISRVRGNFEPSVVKDTAFSQE